MRSITRRLSLSSLFIDRLRNIKYRRQVKLRVGRDHLVNWLHKHEVVCVDVRTLAGVLEIACVLGLKEEEIFAIPEDYQTFCQVMTRTVRESVKVRLPTVVRLALSDKFVARLWEMDARQVVKRLRRNYLGKQIRVKRWVFAHKRTMLSLLDISLNLYFPEDEMFATLDDYYVFCKKLGRFVERRFPLNSVFLECVWSADGAEKIQIDHERAMSWIKQFQAVSSEEGVLRSLRVIAHTLKFPENEMFVMLHDYRLFCEKLGEDIK